MPQSGVSVARRSSDETEAWEAERMQVAAEPRATGGVPGRRTVTIQGRGAERYVPRESRAGAAGGYEAARARRRSQPRAYERPGFRPDRVAMWAVLLGVLLVLAAATSSHAATRTLHAVPSPALYSR